MPYVCVCVHVCVHTHTYIHNLGFPGDSAQRIRCHAGEASLILGQEDHLEEEVATLFF